MKYDIVKLMARRKIRWKKRWVSGDSGGRLTFRSKKAGRLSDYRIYGNTVGGESVGDLVISGQHAGEYKVDVTVEGKNLLPNTATSQTIKGVTFTVNSDGSIVCDGQASPRTAVLIFSEFLVPSGTYILTGCPNGGSETGTYKMLLFINGEWFANDMGSGTNFTLTKTSTASVRIDIYEGYTCDNLTFYPMIRKADIEDDTYEPYHAPITTPIYLPEPIKMVGDEAEYVDYKEQKQHRVRKNLFEGVIVNGSFSSASGDLVTVGNRIRMNGDTFIYLVPGTYTINASGVDDVVYYSYSEADVSTYARSGSQVNWLSLPCTFEVTNAFYFLFGFRFSDNSNISPSDISNIMLNSGSEPLPYEPYIENTDLDVTLPALPTLPGTNVLSVGTAVQPSRVEVKGRIKAVGQETEPEQEEPEQEEPEVKEDDTDDR